MAWSFDFGWVAAFLVGSLLASHTLLGSPVVNRLGLSKSEPVAVTVGATIFTDIASLLAMLLLAAMGAAAADDKAAARDALRDMRKQTLDQLYTVGVDYV